MQWNCLRYNREVSSQYLPTIQRTMRSVRHHAQRVTRDRCVNITHRVDKRTQRALDVRHNFKQDSCMNLGNTDKAVSCYDAFESASLLRKEDTKLSSFGIKAIVGLINFRMTHALLNANRVYDAIVQFIHFTEYGNRIEARTACHWGWMTEIYSEFGTY